MTEEIKQFVTDLIKSKLEEMNKSEETTKENVESTGNGGEVQEIDVDSIFKSEFRLGSTLEQTSWGNTIDNVREHNPEADLEKAYSASPRRKKK